MGHHLLEATTRTLIRSSTTTNGALNVCKKQTFTFGLVPKRNFFTTKLKTQNLFRSKHSDVDVSGFFRLVSPRFMSLATRRQLPLLLSSVTLTDRRQREFTNILKRQQQQQQKFRCFSGTASVLSGGKRDDGDVNDAAYTTSGSGTGKTTILLSNPSKHVAHLELNRPKVKNAFGIESANELCELLDRLEEDPSIRCLLLSGSGPDFTSGVDLKSFMTLSSKIQETEDVGRKAKMLRSICERFQAPFKRMYNLSKPIVCVQHGLCYGLGMELAACSDIRYCSKETKMAIREVLIGIAADVGSLQLMPRLTTNQSLLRELIYTGRDMSSSEARELNFVSEVYETKEAALEAALETAKEIASKSPVAVQGSKVNLRFSCDKPFLVGLDYNAVWNGSMMQSEDVAKAIMAILSRSNETEYDSY